MAVCMMPAMALIAVFVLIKLGRPIFFCQKRPGLHGHPFTLFKFRTMHNISDEKGDPLPDQSRIHLFGKILRTTSLDELPELLNVLKGEMSIVGPRPLLMQYLERYTPLQGRRHEVKPGITGWAQVNGRNAISWERKFFYDVWYVDNISFRLDIKIIAMTIIKVFRREGISAEGEATMPEFRGT